MSQTSEVQLNADSGCVTSGPEIVDNDLSKKAVSNAESAPIKSKAELRAERRAKQVSLTFKHLVVLAHYMYNYEKGNITLFM